MKRVCDLAVPQAKRALPSNDEILPLPSLNSLHLVNNLSCITGENRNKRSDSSPFAPSHSPSTPFPFPSPPPISLSPPPILPVEIITHIYRFMTTLPDRQKFRQVCHQWLAISISDAKTIIRLPSLRMLDDRRHRRIGDPILVKAGKNVNNIIGVQLRKFPNLRSLFLTQMATEHVVESITKYCPHIGKLLLHLKFNTIPLTFLKRLHVLEILTLHLQLNHRSHITVNTISHLYHLTELTLVDEHRKVDPYMNQWLMQIGSVGRNLKN